jgi:probable HAF family extracellular repeat protein
MMVVRFEIVFGILAVVIGTTQPVHAVSYKLTDLGTLDGYQSNATSINNLGQVVGCYDTSNFGTHAFRYDGGGAMQQIDSSDENYSTANGINDHGQVVGVLQDSTNDGAHAFLQNGSGAMQRLCDGWGYGINSSGAVVGASVTITEDNPMGYCHAFLCSSSGTMRDLGTLRGIKNSGSTAYAINDVEQVVGISETDNGETHAFLYSSDNPMQDLGTLGGTWSQAYNINNNGQVVGTSRITGDVGGTHAFLYSDGQMHDLGSFGGATNTTAQDINNSGQIVGWSGAGSFLYDNGVMTDLTSLLTPDFVEWSILAANAINDGGQIACEGQFAHGGPLHAILLTPTPEPSSLVLFAIAAASLFAYAWRRQRQAA